MPLKSLSSHIWGLLFYFAQIVPKQIEGKNANNMRARMDNEGLVESSSRNYDYFDTPQAEKDAVDS